MNVGVDGIIKRTGCAADFLHDYAMCLVAHGKPAIVFIGRDTQEASLLSENLLPFNARSVPSFSELSPHLIWEFIVFVGLGSELLRNLSLFDRWLAMMLWR